MLRTLSCADAIFAIRRKASFGRQTSLRSLLLPHLPQCRLEAANWPSCRHKAHDDFPSCLLSATVGWWSRNFVAHWKGSTNKRLHDPGTPNWPAHYFLDPPHEQRGFRLLRRNPLIRKYQSVRYAQNVEPPGDGGLKVTWADGHVFSLGHLPPSAIQFDTAQRYVHVQGFKGSVEADVAQPLEQCFP